MTYRTSEEVHNNYRYRLGKEFGSIYYHALSEWVDLRVTWKQFESLFGHGKERVDLLNRCGSSFWHRVDRLFFEAVALAVCRLSDPAKTGKKSNLSVMLFEEHMDTPERKAKMEALLETVRAKVGFARDWRNRRISHNDYDLKIGSAEAEGLKPATRNAMNEAILALHSVLSFISSEFMETTLWDDVIDAHENEMIMLHRLYLGDLENGKELNNLKEDSILPEDLPKWLLEDVS